MKNFTLILIILMNPLASSASCRENVDLLVVGDSQVGATWSRSYLGNFLQECLQSNFVMYGRGGTIPGNWMGQGGMDHVETVERSLSQPHLNIGSGEQVPLCKKRIGPMLKSHTPAKVLFEFGGNYIGREDSLVKSQINKLMITVQENGITPDQCYFLTPSYEMEVATQRNIPKRNLESVSKMRDLIVKTINGRCQILDGLEIMKASPYFDGKELLKRISVPGKTGCGGAAKNDNVHICGEAARDFAERVCRKISAN